MKISEITGSEDAENSTTMMINPKISVPRNLIICEIRS